MSQPRARLRMTGQELETAVHKRRGNRRRGFQNQPCGTIALHQAKACWRTAGVSDQRGPRRVSRPNKQHEAKLHDVRKEG